MVESSEDLQFSWGKKKAKGGAKMDIQFYESFEFDNVKYSLYDCVYLYKDGHADPHVGKIVKIWEQPNALKRVKIIWFFLPEEIYDLKEPTMEKEIFLASGEGSGVAEVNPLESIAGKCSIVCVSNDERNRQPTARELELADHIFYRFFDVGSYRICEQPPDRIAGIEVKFLLNLEDEQIGPVFQLEVDGIDKKDGEGLDAAIPCSLAESAPLRILDNIDKPEQDNGPGEGNHLKDVSDEEASLKSRTDLVEEASDTDHRNIKCTKNKSKSILPGASPSKKIKLSHDATGSAMDLQNQASQKISIAESEHPKDIEQNGQLHSEKAVRAAELTTRPTDRRKWFKGYSWNDRLKMADEEGRLLYIQNLSVHFAPSDIEGIIDDALQTYCTAKLINHPTYGDPNNGKAYLIFKSKEAADVAASKINGGLVVCGRPVYCSKGMLKVPKPSNILPGHLISVTLKKLLFKQREEQKRAVSTSHCSQPNTIEYDMALEWIWTYAKQVATFEALHDRHLLQWKGFSGRSADRGK